MCRRLTHHDGAHIASGIGELKAFLGGRDVPVRRTEDRDWPIEDDECLCWVDFEALGKLLGIPIVYDGNLREMLQDDPRAADGPAFWWLREVINGKPTEHWWLASASRAATWASDEDVAEGKMLYQVRLSCPEEIEQELLEEDRQYRERQKTLPAENPA